MRLKNCSTQNFIKDLNGRKVICFGAGTTLMEAELFSSAIEHLEDYIAFFVDNDSNKHESKFIYKDKAFNIHHPDILKSLNPEDYVLLITCDYYFDIYDQLKNITELTDFYFYVFSMITLAPDVDLNQFFLTETKKHPFKDWREILTALKLKNKYNGRRCFVVGNGPSLSAADLDLLKDEITFAANGIYRIFPETSWRPTYYLCTDIKSYRIDYHTINHLDASIKLVPWKNAILAGEVYDGITYYNKNSNCSSVDNGKVIWNTSFAFSDNPEEIVYSGQTVLYDALQFAVYMGFSEIYLLGVDCSFQKELKNDGTIVETDAKANYFSSEYTNSLSQAAAPADAMKMAFQKAGDVCKSKNIIIKNATRGGNLEVLDRISLEEALNK